MAYGRPVQLGVNPRRFVIARGRSPEAISGFKAGIASAQTARLAMTNQRLNFAIVY
jgi:hypothetical protein